MVGLFDGTPLERPVTCEVCEQPIDDCRCPRDSTGNVRRPAEQTARIRLQRRGKGKTVTLIAGLDLCPGDLRAVLRRLQQRCGVGGTVSASDGTLELQGDQQAAAADGLRELGYKVNVS